MTQNKELTDKRDMHRLWAIFLTGLLMTSQIWGKTGPCFDLSKPLKNLWKTSEFLPKSSENGLRISWNSTESYHYAGVKGLIHKPIRRVLDAILDHKNMKDMNRTHLKNKITQRKGFIQLHDLFVKVRLIPFVSISWKEEWAYQLFKGTYQRPQAFLAYFQKTQGTRHIKHYCGQYYIQKKSTHTTQLFIYEEINATRRKAKDLGGQIWRTFQTIQFGKNFEKTISPENKKKYSRTELPNQQNEFPPMVPSLQE